MSDINLFLLKDFIAQATEYLTDFQTHLNHLTLGEANQALYKSLYTPLFAMKSAAEFIGLEQTSALTRCVAKLLELLDHQQIACNEGIKNILFKSLEAFAQLLDALDESAAETCKTQPLVEEIEQLISHLKITFPAHKHFLNPAHSSHQFDLNRFDGADEKKGAKIPHESTAILEKLSGNDLLEQLNTAKQLVAIGTELAESKQDSSELYDIFIQQMRQRFSRLFALIEQVDIDDELKLSQIQAQLQTLSSEAADMGTDKLHAYFSQWQGDLMVAHDSQLGESVAVLAMRPFNDLLNLFGISLDEIKYFASDISENISSSSHEITQVYSIHEQPTQVIEPLTETDESFLETGVYGSETLNEDEQTGYLNSQLVESIAELQTLCEQCNSLDANPNTIAQFNSTLSVLSNTAHEQGLEPLEQLCEHWIQQIDQANKQQQHGLETSWSFMSNFIAKVVKMIPSLSFQTSNIKPQVDQRHVEVLTQQLQQSQQMLQHETLDELLGEIIEEIPNEQSSEAITNSLNFCDKQQLDDLKQQVAQLHKVTSYFSQLGANKESVDAWQTQFNQIQGLLQETSKQLHHSMQLLRQRPLTNAVDELPSRVKQWAKKHHKTLHIEINKTDLQVDMDLLHHLTPCLIELVNNAIEHGIETSEIRQRLNKSAIGKIQLNITQHYQILHIEMVDDGHGLYLEKIKYKALAQNLISPEDMSQLSQAEIYTFIFKAGLSTVPDDQLGAERGMGLVAVKQHVEKMYGDIQLATLPGQFSQIQLHIPLIPLMLKTVQFNLAEKKYLVPYDALLKILQLNATFELHLEDEQQIVWNDESLSIYHLDKILGLADTASRSILILQLNQRKIGLVVNKVLSIEEVSIAACSSSSRLFTQALTHHGEHLELLNLLELAHQVASQ